MMKTIAPVSAICYAIRVLSALLSFKKHVLDEGHMELLVVTLAYTTPGRDADALARIRFISDTVRNAPGLVTSRFYRSRGNDSYYIMLTTWDDDESWQKAQKRHNPRQLLLGSAKELLTAAPQQWLMRYLWGYSRPGATPVVAATHLCTIRPDQTEFVQPKYIEGLRHYATQPMLAFALLARGAHEEGAHATRSASATSPTGSTDTPYQPGTTFLSLFSWGSEEEREDFYSDPYTRTLNRFVNNIGTTRVLLLEPM
jgi:heme-degrading monooxygenase HmoA